MSWQLVRYVLTAAIRDRLVMALMIVMILAVSLSMFFGSAVILEKQRFALVFSGAGLRLSGVLGLILFVVFFIRRSFDARDVEFLLSRPISRVEFLLSYAAGFSVLAILITAMQAFCLYVISPHQFDHGHLMWVVTMGAENIIMANTALFFSMILASAPTAAMATVGFYVLSRLMGQLLGIIDAHEQNKIIYQILEYILQGISMIMPRLDLMSQTSWLIYDPGSSVNFSFILIQGFVFTALVVVAALVDLVRKQF